MVNESAIGGEDEESPEDEKSQEECGEQACVQNQDAGVEEDKDNIDSGKLGLFVSCFFCVLLRFIPMMCFVKLMLQMSW